MEIVEFINKYKVIIGSMIAIIGAVFFIKDYFATKVEVAVLQCQMQNSIDQTDSKMKSDQLGRQIVSLKRDLTSQANPSVKQPELETEIDRLKNLLDQEQKREFNAAGNLAPGVCEKILRGK